MDSTAAVALLVGGLLLLGFCCLVGYLGARKGYNFFLWFLSAGIIGLIVLAFLPYTNKGDMSAEEAAKKRATGNWIGAGIALFSIVIGFARGLAGSH